jgi:two-component system, OmpR family, alkaline phosphatase synthesis response regulator PhoP
MLRQEAAAVGIEGPVLVVDPDPAQRTFIGAVLGRAGFRTEVVATGEQALEAARLRRPRLVVLEVRLGDISGYEVCRALREEFDDAVGIVFVSADRIDACDRVAGLMIGADDYLCKPLARDELIARVRALARRAHAHTKAPALQAGLTARELEVLRLLADGYDQEAIAAKLFITPKTVAKHIEHILTKLPARSRAEAVAIAYQRGLHTPSAGAPVATA